MPISLTINGTVYPFPTQGDSPPWGDELTSSVAAIVSGLNTLIGAGDILTTIFTIANNQSSASNVTGLAFDNSTVRSAAIFYSIYRSSNTPSEYSETGTIYITYKPTAGSWELAQVGVGSSGVTFTITSSGQIRYTSTNIGSGAYVGKMVFKASSFLQ